MPHRESWKTTPYNVQEVDATVPWCSMVKVYKNWRLATLEIPWSHLNPFADQIISPVFHNKKPSAHHFSSLSQQKTLARQRRHVAGLQLPSS
jgi:hypothetical protein